MRCSDRWASESGKRARLDCYTEVVLAGGLNEAGKIRPDGLMVLDGGRSREWRCLIEAKTGRAEVDPEQLTTYLGLARKCGIDGVLTVSNQFVALPTHSPVKIAKTASRGVQTYHWSWISVLTNAELLLGEDSFDHPEQRYLLSEVVRYFAHPSVSVATFDRMNPEWKELNSKVQAGVRLAKSAPEVEASVAAWHQECRDMSLLMSRTLNRPVRQRLSRAHAVDPFARVTDESEHLVGRHELRSVLEIPDAAAPLVVTADLQRRCLSVSASLAAPQDKQRASSRINWILRQLAKSDPADIHVRAHWPGRAPDTQVPLAALRENPGLLEPDNRSLVPTQFDVLLISDIAGRFAGTKTFIELLEDVVISLRERVEGRAGSCYRTFPGAARARGPQLLSRSDKLQEGLLVDPGEGNRFQFMMYLEILLHDVGLLRVNPANGVGLGCIYQCPVRIDAEREWPCLRGNGFRHPNCRRQLFLR